MNAAAARQRTAQARQSTDIVGSSSTTLLQSFLAQIKVAAGYGRASATVHRVGYCDINQQTLRAGGDNWRERLHTEMVLYDVNAGWFNEALRSAIRLLSSDEFSIQLHLRPDSENVLTSVEDPLHVQSWSVYLVVTWPDEDRVETTRLVGNGASVAVGVRS